VKWGRVEPPADCITFPRALLVFADAWHTLRFMIQIEQFPHHYAFHNFSHPSLSYIILSSPLS
jgi:hypothetical protein